MINDEAIAIFMEIRSRDKLTQSTPKFPGLRFTPQSDYFKVLVGMPQGRAISMFLFQHKKEFGAKTVTAVTWSAASDDNLTLFLAYEIGDPPPADEMDVDPQPPARQQAEGSIPSLHHGRKDSVISEFRARL